MGKKKKYIANFVSLVLCAAIFSIITLMLEDVEWLITIIHVPIFIIAIHVCQFLDLKFGENTAFYFIAKIVISCFSLIVSIIFLSNVVFILAFIDVLIAVFGYYLILTGYYFILMCIVNSGKEKPMTYAQKLLEVPLQIGLVFVSVIIELCCACFIFFAHFLGRMIVVEFLYNKLKSGGLNFYYYYNDGKSKMYGGGYFKTKTYDIKDTYGKKIGTIETQGEYVDEEAYFEEGWHKNAFKNESLFEWLYAFLALPCRIISLLLSILALFIPCIYVSARTPKCEKFPLTKQQLDNGEYDTDKIYFCDQNLYSDTPYRFFDLIALTKEMGKEKNIKLY